MVPLGIGIFECAPATISFVQSSYNLVVVLGNRLLAEQVPVLQKRLSTPAAAQIKYKLFVKYKLKFPMCSHRSMKNLIAYWAEAGSFL
jgi:hypothetical protein